MGWHMVMDFTPLLVGSVITSRSYSFELVRRSGECVFNLPTTSPTDAMGGVGKTSGAEVGAWMGRNRYYRVSTYRIML
jgi:flavin reductase (DIM6/NTAB) family NADH-FMN oxidoreductase RutF